MTLTLKKKFLTFLKPIKILNNALAFNSTYPINDDLFGLNSEQKEVCLLNIKFFII